MFGASHKIPLLPGVSGIIPRLCDTPGTKLHRSPEIPPHLSGPIYLFTGFQNFSGTVSQQLYKSSLPYTCETSLSFDEFPTTQCRGIFHKTAFFFVLIFTKSTSQPEGKSLQVAKLFRVHPGRLTWNLQITHLERKMIFQTSRELWSMLIFQVVELLGMLPPLQLTIRIVAFFGPWDSKLKLHNRP